MIERLDIKDYENKEQLVWFGVINKINALVDAVNKLETMAKNTNTVLESLVVENNIHEKQIDELQMKLEPQKCETPTENVLDEIEKAKKDGTVIFPNPEDVAAALTKSLRMDKEFAEAEYVRLQNKLERTRKALDVAVDALKNIGASYPRITDIAMQDKANKALDKITALEQKDVK